MQSTYRSRWTWHVTTLVSRTSNNHIKNVHQRYSYSIVYDVHTVHIINYLGAFQSPLDLCNAGHFSFPCAWLWPPLIITLTLAVLCIGHGSFLHTQCSHEDGVTTTGIETQLLLGSMWFRPPSTGKWLYFTWEQKHRQSKSMQNLLPMIDVGSKGSIKPCLTRTWIYNGHTRNKHTFNTK